MSTIPAQRKLALLFCKITMKLEDLHDPASLGMSSKLELGQYLRLAHRVQKELIQILVLAASAEELTKGPRKCRQK